MSDNANQTPMINLTIDGQPVSVPKGWSVLKASRKLGVEIPHYCAHPGLSVAGACRLCMVEVKGRPKTEIACNLEATEGMEILTKSPLASAAQKAVLEFHLVNHPLDCPICDQAGECGLQNYYMTIGGYKSRMKRPKVLKPKALDVGRDLVLDVERCILCKRCVRFESEITRTDALQVLDRGDRAVIALTGKGKIDHNYSTNLVDICPVGAFTSRDFRFKQRVWFVKEQDAICPGCSTNCRVTVAGRPQRGTFFRLKPRADESVNGHWMCDVGRSMYRHLNIESRVSRVLVNGAPAKLDDAARALRERLASASSPALLVSAQYTNEEYASLLSWWKQVAPAGRVYAWRADGENRDDFDGILYRGDHNANTRGLDDALKAAGLTICGDLNACVAAHPDTVVALVPEIPSTMPTFDAQLQKLATLGWVAALAVGGDLNRHAFACVFPLKGFAEKKGTFTNFKGIAGALTSPFPCAVHDARDVSELVTIVKGA